MDDDMDIDVVADENGQQINSTPTTAANRTMDVTLEEDDDHAYSLSSAGSTYVEDEEGATMVELKKKNFNATPAVRAAPVELPTNTRLRVKVNKLCVTAEWKWIEGGDDTCGICRMAFEACCNQCKCPGDECPLVLGQCKHPFHMHCIVKWTDAQNTPKPQCPLCRQEWKFAD
ncbi:hypothetical protein KIN20_032078 [Parelaphostrongylus tenuis]|uniref:Anaphase-promoting complex subunit 11 n=1 Tax=Parelaphostrongylus tenuis TaxID=148309 RepID=A0AAD5WH91_PARTN|nr:hypothetical protein KIN20_032078 [Parelaphostrongylus tenuis]